jgi:hypothetical protein
MPQFRITLKNVKLKLYNRLSWFIIIIINLLFIYLAFFNGDNTRKSGKVAFLIVMALCLLLKLYFEKTTYRFDLHVLFYFLVFGFLSIGQYLAAGITFFFLLLQFISSRKQIVSFSEAEIIYPSFPVRTIEWETLNNSLLKDGLLTIDFKSNKIIQQLIDEEKTTINEKEFNDFCQRKLNK